MDNLSDLIRACIVERGNKNNDFALFFIDYGENKFRADIGNPSNFVMLGETEGELSCNGKTPLEAVQGLLALMRGHKQRDLS